jgi:hypothetical protein
MAVTQLLSYSILRHMSILKYSSTYSSTWVYSYTQAHRYILYSSSHMRRTCSTILKQNCRTWHSASRNASMVYSRVTQAHWQWLETQTPFLSILKHLSILKTMDAAVDFLNVFFFVCLSIKPLDAKNREVSLPTRPPSLHACASVLRSQTGCCDQLIDSAILNTQKLYTQILNIFIFTAQQRCSWGNFKAQ